MGNNYVFLLLNYGKLTTNPIQSGDCLFRMVETTDGLLNIDGMEKRADGSEKDKDKKQVGGKAGH